MSRRIEQILYSTTHENHGHFSLAYSDKGPTTRGYYDYGEDEFSFLANIEFTGEMPIHKEIIKEIVRKYIYRRYMPEEIDTIDNDSISVNVWDDDIIDSSTDTGKVRAAKRRFDQSLHNANRRVKPEYRGQPESNEDFRHMDIDDFEDWLSRQ